MRLAITFALAALAAQLLAAPGAASNKSSVHDPFCSSTSAQIMILGIYHFANPGLDGRNVRADDVLALRRQRELEEVADKLARFQPTAIMVEAPYRDPELAAAYAGYLSGKRALERNETEQIGFRIAKKLGLKRVTPIDFPMRMSGLRPDELDDDWRPKPTPTPPTTAAPAPSPQPTEEERQLYALSVRENLFRLNDPSGPDKEHSRDYLPLLRPDPDTAALYERSDYLVNWYKRNFRMFANIVRETRFPGDRVLVIVGSGHLKILRDLARDADYFCLVDARDYLR